MHLPSALLHGELHIDGLRMLHVPIDGTGVRLRRQVKKRHFFTDSLHDGVVTHRRQERLEVDQQPICFRQPETIFCDILIAVSRQISS